MQDIIDSICALLAAKFPTSPVYVDNQEEGFERPSFFVNLINDNTESLCSVADISTLNIQIVYFSPLNDYKTTDKVSQLGTYTVLKQIFSKGYINVGTRASKINNLTGGPKGQDVYLTLNITWTDDKYIAEEDYDLMNNIIIS